MGFLSSLFGSSKSQPQTTVVQQTPTLPSEIAPKVQEIADEAKRLYDERVAEGYVPFEGATIAPFTQQELDAQRGIEGLVGLSAPLQQEALGITRQQGEQFTGDVAQQYMNPYQQAVIDIEKRKAQEDFESRILPQFEKQAVGAGGMSGLGSRAGVQAALLGEAQAERLGDIQARGLQQAFIQGRQEFGAQKAREAGQAAQLAKAGPAMFASGLAEQGALAGVGEQRRELAQEALDEAYFRFLEERGEPQAALAEYSSTVYANPLNTIPTLNKQTTAPGQPSVGMGSQLLGLGLNAASMYYGGGFGGAPAIPRTRAGGGRIDEGLSGMVYRNVGSAIGTVPSPEVPDNYYSVGLTREAAERVQALDKLRKDLEANKQPDEARNVMESIRAIRKNDMTSRRNGTSLSDVLISPSSRSKRAATDLPLGLTVQTPKTTQGGLQTIKEADRASLSPSERQVINNTPSRSGNVTMPEPAILGMPSTNEQGGGMLASETILSRPKDTVSPPPNEEAYDVGKDILRQLAGMDDRVASEVAAAKAEDLTYRTERNRLIKEQREDELKAFNTLSDSQTKRLADEMLRRREEITGRDNNITLSKAFGVAAKSFSDPNLSIVQQISGAMSGMNETMVAERLLQREQLSELDREEFDKETVIIDRKLTRNLETMQKNNAQDLSILNLDRAGQKELAALPAQKRKDILANAASLASIFDDLLPDADSTKAFDITATREDLRGAIAQKFGFTFDRQTGTVTKNGNPLQGADARKMSNLSEYAIKILNNRYQANPTAQGSSAAYVEAQEMAEAARKRMDALGKNATEEQLEIAMRGSTAPANTTNLDRAVAAYNDDPSSISPENLKKLNAALISMGRPALGI
jgi:hypothetical protein